MTYIYYKIFSDSEILMALLSMYPFESFEEHDDYMIGYISDINHTQSVSKDIKAIIESHEVKFSTGKILPQNWNAVWESSFDPVIIDDFCSVRADFHPQNKKVKHDIIVNPKMAFGTGHHETTYMMVKAMSEIDFKGKKVLDYGCGTGVLAILASLEKASIIDAIDIEEESYLNTLENAQTNNCQNINVFKSTLEDFNNKGYDIILANINRNVLLKSSNRLKSILNLKGLLIISGILDEDEGIITENFTSASFSIHKKIQKGKWLCMELHHA